MAKQTQQMTEQQLLALKEHQNAEFMRLSRENEIRLNSENGKQYQAGRTLTFNSPILAGSFATGILLKLKLNVNWDAGTTGTIAPNSAYPYNLISKYEISFGNKQQSGTPYIHKLRDLMEGYARGLNDASSGFVNSGIEEMIRKVPTTFVEGDNEVVFQIKIPLNLLHEQTVNGLLPISGSGTRLQVGVQLPSSVTGKDPLDNVFNVAGDGAAEVTGEVEGILVYRDYNSMSTTQPVQPDLTGVPTVQLVELPSITGLTPKTFNHVSVRNPYNFASIFNIVIDGLQSDEFSKPANITGFGFDKQENSSSAFFRYGEDIGMDSYYRKIRSLYGQDMPSGCFVFQASDENTSNVSSKLGSAYLNLSQNGYSASRFIFRVDEVGHETGIASRVLNYGVLINDTPIQAV